MECWFVSKFIIDLGLMNGVLDDQSEHDSVSQKKKKKTLI